MLAAPKYSVSYLLMVGEVGGGLIYQLYLDCTRITIAIGDAVHLIPLY